MRGVCGVLQVLALCKTILCKYVLSKSRKLSRNYLEDSRFSSVPTSNLNNSPYKDRSILNPDQIRMDFLHSERYCYQISISKL